MNLPFIVDEIASRADEFLAGVTDRAQARAGISELINLDYAGVSPEFRAEIIRGVMEVLESEDFFGIEFVGDPFADEEAGMEER